MKGFNKILLACALSAGALVPGALLLTGCSAPEAEYRVKDGYVQCKNDNDEWSNIVFLEDITGKMGEKYSIGTDGYWYFDGEKTNEVAFDLNQDEDAKLVVYDYGKFVDLFEGRKVGEEVATSGDTTLNAVPKVKQKYAAAFLGWFEKGTDNLVTNDQPIEKNCVLEPRFDSSKNLAGLYQDGQFVMPWERIVKLYPLAFAKEGTISAVVKNKKACFAELEGTLIIDDSVSTIEDRAFIGCNLLKEVVVPKSVSKIGTCVFSNCTALEKIAVDEHNEIYASPNGCNGIVDKESKTLLYGCKKTIIPDGVKTIAVNAFEGSMIEDIAIPSSVTKIEAAAFSGCLMLKEVVVADANSISVGTGVFSGCSSLARVVIYAESATIGASAFESCATLRVVEINAKAEIKNRAFKNCISLENASLLEVTMIEEAAFQNCTALEKINLTGTTRLEKYAFDGCSALKEFSVDSITEFGIYAFARCAALEKIVISQDGDTYGKSIGSNAVVNIKTGTLVAGCKGTKVPVEATRIAAYAFYGSDIQSIEIPSTTTIIEDNAFYNCVKLKEVTVENKNFVANLDDVSSWGNLLANAETVYVEGFSYTDDALFLNSNYTRLSITDKQGYIKFVKGTVTEQIPEDQKFNVYLKSDDNGTVTGDGEYKYGEEIQLKAVAKEGYAFYRWSDGNEDAVRTFAADEDVFLTAEFRKGKTFTLSSGKTIDVYGENVKNIVVSENGDSVTIKNVITADGQEYFVLGDLYPISNGNKLSTYVSDTGYYSPASLSYYKYEFVERAYEDYMMISVFKSSYKEDETEVMNILYRCASANSTLIKEEGGYSFYEANFKVSIYNGIPTKQHLYAQYKVNGVITYRHLATKEQVLNKTLYYAIGKNLYKISIT